MSAQGLDITETLSERMIGLIPDYIRDEAPVFEQFLRAYFEYLEAEIIIIDTQENIDVIASEDGMSAILYESATTAPSPDKDFSKIAFEQSSNNFNFSTAGPLATGDLIYGKSSGSLARISVINGNILFINSIAGMGFSTGELVESRTTGQRFTVKSYKENTILANNRLLDFSDIDRTSESFMQYFQKDFIPSLKFSDVQANRLAIKNIGNFYGQKGSEESLKYLIRILYGDDTEIRYPINETIFASESGYSQRKRMVIEMVSEYDFPEATDRITQYDNEGKIVAESVIESIQYLDVADNTRTYSLDINQTPTGVFGIDQPVKLKDRDGITLYDANIRGVVSGTISGASSTYLSHESAEDEVVLYEDENGLSGGGMLLEEESIGSLYRLNDKINFTGSKDDSDAYLAEGIVNGLSSGGIEYIYIEDSGTGYYSTYQIGIQIPVNNSINIAVTFPLTPQFQPGLQVFGSSISGDLRIVSIAADRLSMVVSKRLTLKVGDCIQIGAPQLVVFDNNNTGGNGAVGYLGSIGDQIILENAPDVFGQYVFTADAGQTLFQGRDDNGKRLAFNDNTVQVWVDEILRREDDGVYGYAQKNDRITFNNGLQAGQVVDIYHEYNYLVYEDGRSINLENDSILLNGTLDFVSGSVTVTGTNTLFTEYVKPGDTLIDSSEVSVSGCVVVNGSETVTNTSGLDVFKDGDTVEIDGVLYTVSADGIFNSITLTTPIITPSTVGVDTTTVLRRPVEYTVQLVVSNTELELSDNASDTRTDTSVTRLREDGAIRSIILPDKGYNYTAVPRCWPGGYFYFESAADVSTFQINETVIGGTSGAQATILYLEPDKNRMVVKRESTQSGRFVFGESIEGNNSGSIKIPSQINVASGTGAKLYAWSSQIGGVTGINIQSQGFNYNEPAQLDASSTGTMLVTSPTSSLNKGTTITGRVSGSTATLIFYDSDRHIVYYKDLVGSFLFNEFVDYNIVDSFKIMKADPYNARGEIGGSGIVQRQLLTDTGQASSTAANLQDGMFYQTHSYVIKTSQSINAYRSVIKDLVHPAGHIFFGEVSVQNQISDTRITTKFAPTIIIHGDPVLAVPDAFQFSRRVVEMFTRTVGLITEDNEILLMEDGGQIIVTLDDEMNFLNDPLLKLMDAGAAGPDKDPTTGGPLQLYAIAGGIQTGAGTEYYDSGMRNHHVNLKIISTFASAAQRNKLANRYITVDPNILEYVSQKPYRSLTGDVQEGDFPVITQSGVYRSADRQSTGGGLTVLNLDQPNPITEIHRPLSSKNTRFGGVDGYFNPESRKLSEQGKILSYQTVEDEQLIYEDGTKVILEDEINLMRYEPRIYAEITGDFGDYLIFEDNEYLELEDGTIIHEDHYFITERSYEYSGNSLYTEDGYQIFTENNERLVNEQSSENSLSSFVPLGTSLKSLNRLIGQRIYNISYYVKSEEGDDILFEDGTGGIISESCESEGIRISQLQTYYDWWIPEFDKRSRKRTSLTYSSYIKSA